MARLLAQTGLVDTGQLVPSSITALGTVTSGTISTGAVVDDPTMTQGSDATGDVYYRAADGKLTRLATTADGHVLTSTGVGAVPAWEAAAGPAVRSFYSASYTVPLSVPSATPNLVWTASNLSITVPSAEVAKCSKILISVQNSLNLNPDTHVQIALRIERTGPIASTVGWNDAIGMNGSYTLYPNGNIFGIDSSLSTGDHTYQLQFRDGQGTTTHGAGFAYHGPRYSINYITAIGVV